MLGRRRRRESAVPGRAAGSCAGEIEVKYSVSGFEVPEQKDNWASKSLLVFIRGFFRG